MFAPASEWKGDVERITYYAHSDVKQYAAQLVCDFSNKPALRKSKQPWSQHRMFLTCYKKECNFFMWIDQPISHGIKERLSYSPQSWSCLDLVLILCNGPAFRINRLSKFFRLLIANSVDSNQSNPSVSSSSFWVFTPSLSWRWDLFSLHASTVDPLRVLFSAFLCKQEQERFRLLLLWKWNNNYSGVIQCKEL